MGEWRNGLRGVSTSDCRGVHCCRGHLRECRSTLRALRRRGLTFPGRSVAGAPDELLRRRYCRHQTSCQQHAAMSALCSRELGRRDQAGGQAARAVVVSISRTSSSACVRNGLIIFQAVEQLPEIDKAIAHARTMGIATLLVSGRQLHERMSERVTPHWSVSVRIRALRAGRSARSRLPAFWLAAWSRGTPLVR